MLKFTEDNKQLINPATMIQFIIHVTSLFNGQISFAIPGVEPSPESAIYLHKMFKKMSCIVIGEQPEED